jgi:hypothetical protein
MGAKVKAFVMGRSRGQTSWAPIFSCVIITPTNFSEWILYSAVVTRYGGPPLDLARSHHYLFLNFWIQVVLE